MTHSFVPDWGERHKGQPALVIGNGRSRLHFQIEELIWGTDLVTFGCNALYRDVSPDYLLAMDEKILLEILATDYARLHPVIVSNTDFLRLMEKLERSPEELPNVSRLLLDHTDFQSTGNTAIYVAGLLGCDPVYAIGFDGKVVTPQGEQNNVYAGTPGYETHYAYPEVEQKSWIHGFQTALDFGGANVIMPKLEGTEEVYPRVTYMGLEQFLRGACARV